MGFDTLVGMGVGAAAVWYLWNKLDEWAAGDYSSGSGKRSLRKFAADDLALYNGKDGKLCYIALNDGSVYDVSKKKEAFVEFGGKMVDVKTEQNLPFDEVKEKFTKVGELIIMRNFTKAELAAFDGRDGRPVYVCAKGIVYDVDPEFYGPDGPYGIMAGRDASRALALVSLDQADIDNTSLEGLSWMDLNTLEEWIAKFEMKYHRVGYLVDSETGIAPAAPPARSFLTKERQQVRLAEKIPLSHDTRLFRFALPEMNMRLGLPIGKHIKIWCENPKPVKEGEWNGRPDPEAGKKEIERKYTPSSSDDHLGYIDIVIKVYEGGKIDHFPDGGKMSQYLDSLEVGDMIGIAGPFGRIEYLGTGQLRIGRKEKQVKMIGMLAGGTGITPMLQLIKAVLKDPKDETKLSLLFANQTEDDILVRDMLEAEAQKHPNRFKLWYTVDRPPPNWKYSSGFIDDVMIKSHMPPPSDETIILMCGPPPMIKFACKPNLEKLGYDKDFQVEF